MARNQDLDCFAARHGFNFVSDAELVALLLFFFFQAEDGIRDIGVTGVQTCALPIWATCRGMPDALAYSEANNSLSGYCSVNSHNNSCARASCFSRRAARASTILANGFR